MKNLYALAILILLGQATFSQSKVDNPILDLGNDTTICTGDVLLLDAGLGFDTYLWQDGSTDQTYFVIEPGVYWVNAFSGSTIYSDTIEIYIWPYPDPLLGNDTTICFGNSYLLEPQIGFLSYLWQDGSNLPFYVAIQAGIYHVTVNDIHGCIGSDTIIIDITTAVDLGSDTVICECDSLLLDAGDGFISYLWQDGSTSQYFLIDGGTFGVGSHSFSVAVVDSNNCESEDNIQVYIDEYTQLNQKKNLTLQVYPNPANDELNIDFVNFPNEVYSFNIIDKLGSIVMTGKIKKTDSQSITQLKINNLESGIYCLQISNRNNFVAQKILIRR